MHHKAQAIFNYMNRLIGLRKQKNNNNRRYHDYLIPADISLVFNIDAHYDTFNKDEISYFEVYIYDNVAEKQVMVFSINGGGGMVVRDGFEEKGVRFPQERFINLLLVRFNLNWQFDNPISVQEISPIPPGSNPYNHDSWRQGASISDHWEVMFTSRGGGEIDNVRLIHNKSGRRFSLDLYEAEKALPATEKVM